MHFVITRIRIHIMKKITLLFAGLMALAVAGCVKSTPEQAVDEFYKATQNNDYTTALTYTNISDKEKEPLVNLLENMEMVIYEYEILGSNIDKGDSTATVYLRLVTANNINPDSSETELNVPCVKMGRHWKVKFI